jgi:hypothetical protein
MQSINRNPDKKELRNFGLVTGGLIPIIFGLLLPWLFERNFPGWPWMVGAVLLIWAAILPKTLKPVYLVWMTLGNALGWINTRIILSIMFYLIILPVGLVMRLTGKDPMAQSITREQRSYRVISAVPDKKHVERPF